MTHDIDVTIEIVLTAKLVYRGIEVEIKTEPSDYESAKKKLLFLVKEAKGSIDYAAAKAEADRKAGIRRPHGDPTGDR